MVVTGKGERFRGRKRDWEFKHYGEVVWNADQHTIILWHYFSEELWELCNKVLVFGWATQQHKAQDKQAASEIKAAEVSRREQAATATLLEYSSKTTAACGLSQGAQEGIARRRSSEKALLSPGFSQVSMSNRKSSPCVEIRSFRIKVLFVTENNLPEFTVSCISSSVRRSYASSDDTSWAKSKKKKKKTQTGKHAVKVVEVPTVFEQLCIKIRICPPNVTPGT